ncbi:hypothetical protein ABK040_004062 [Willaertia magna]
MTQLVLAGDHTYFKGLMKLNEKQNFTLQIIPEEIKIKKIISGGAYRYDYNFIWTEENKIYLLSPITKILSKDKLKKYFIENVSENKIELDYKKFILDLHYNDEHVELEIKDIIGNAAGLFFWMKNNYLYYFSFSKETVTQIKSLHQLKIITKFGTGIMADSYLFKDEGGNCYLGSDKDAIEINKNEIDNGDPLFFGCCSDHLNTIITKKNKIYVKKSYHSFTYTESKFEKESRVIDLKCGFRHNVILLENNTKRVSTYLKDKNVDKLNYFNSVSCGPWHYVIYRKSENISKALEYFMLNMRKRVVQFSDVTFTW